MSFDFLSIISVIIHEILKAGVGMSLKVLFVHGGTLEKAGTERYMMNVLNHAQSHDIHIDFLVFGTKESFYDEEVLMRGSKIYRIPYQFHDFKKQHVSIRKIKKQIEKENYDIVHSHMNALNYRVIKEMKKLGIKYSISHSHATRHFAENSHLISFLDQEKPKIADEANILLACSNEAGEFLYGNKNFIVLHNGIDLHSFGYSKKIRNAMRDGLNLDDKLVIGHAGRFTFEKNHNFVIDVFNELHKIKINSELLLLGEGPLEEKVMQKVKAYGLEKNVQFLGVQEYIEDYYQAMDIFLLPSLFEGLVTVLIEAQASGLLCIASEDLPHLSDLTEHIYYQPIDDPKVWANLILEKQDYKRRSQTEQLQEHGFDATSDVLKLFEIYERLIK